MGIELLRPRLAREHEAWLEEMQEALGPARQAEAGTWARWNALRYLESTFPERVEREREMVRALAERLRESERARLWALGELLELFPAYLARTIGLCHRAEEFGALTGRLEVALDRWCRAVEEDLGPLPVTALPPKLREPELDAAPAR
ncbi:MAG TPA: hypothetical protein VF046_10195 [Gemmatimonadales bacterium]